MKEALALGKHVLSEKPFVMTQAEGLELVQIAERSDRRSGATLASLYRASSILVLPSTGEGFPLVIQEALACGLPVLCGLETASADSSACSFVTGAPVDPRDPEQTAQLFSQEMARLLAKPNTTAERMKLYQPAART